MRLGLGFRIKARVEGRLVVLVSELGSRVRLPVSQPGSHGFSLLQALHMLPVYSRNNALFKTKLKVRDKRQTGSSELLASCRFLWFGKGGEGGGARGLV